MVLGIFIGGIFLGFSVGFATMALVAARGLRLQSRRGASDRRIILPAPTLPSASLALRWRARPQASGVWLPPGP